MRSHCGKCGRLLPGTEPDVATHKHTDTICKACRDATVNADSIDKESVNTTTLGKSRDSDDRIAHFSLIRILGRGSFGDVWLADDSRLGRAVALKLPTAYRSGSSTLLHEAKTAASLRHPNIVTVYEIGEEEGQVYIASELIDGITLQDFLSSGRPPLKRAIELLVPITKAIQFAHEHGVVHRDIKPANILLDQEGTPYVTDFGLAKRLTADETISSEGQVVGTVRYMSPEQASGNTVDTDARSDIYSVGVIMFEMLTGESPFRGNARAILEQKVTDEAPSLRSLDSSIPRDIETICLKCLEREPIRRHSSAKHVVEELQRFVDGAPIRSRPIGKVERGWRWCKKRPAVSGLVLALFLSLVTGLAGVSYYWLQSVRSANAAQQKLYRSWMNLAASRMDNGNPEGVRDLLTRIAADPNLAKLRGFEFEHFTNLVDQAAPVGSVGTPVIDVAITYDGNTGAATNGGKEIKVWDANNDRVLRVLSAEQEGFTTIDFCTPNSRLVAGSIDGFLRVYDPLASEKMIRQMRHGPPVRFAAFSPDGHYVIAAGIKGAIRLWDSDTGELLVEVPTGKGETRAIRFSADSSRLYVARDDGLIREWSITDLLATGMTSIPVPKSNYMSSPAPVAMSVSDGGDQMVVAFYNGGILIRDLPLNAKASQSKTLRLYSGGLIQDVEHLSGSSSVALTNSSGSLYLLDTPSRRVVRSLTTHAATGRLARSGNGKLLLLGSGDGSVSKLVPQRLRKPLVLWGQAPVRSLGFVGPQKLIAAYENEDVALWDLATGTQVAFDSRELLPTTLLATSSARRLIATAGNRSGIEIRKFSNLQTVADLPAAVAGVTAMRFSQSGELFAFAVRKGPVRVYSVNNWLQPRFEVAAMDQLVSSVAVSLDDQTVALARSDHLVQLLDANDGHVVGSIPLEDDEPSVVEFCQDGVTLAIGTATGRMLFYDLASRQVRASSKGHAGPINALAVLPHSQTVVSAGRDKSLNLWDLESGDLVTQLRGHLRQVFTISASADGKTLVSGGLEGDIRIWEGD